MSNETGHPFTFTDCYRGDNVKLCGQCMKPESLHKFGETSKLTNDCKLRHGVLIVDHGLFGDTYSCESRLDK